MSDLKKLLVLGSNALSGEIIEYAKSRGIYTYAADYFPPEKSFAKRLADESVLLSTADTEALVSFCKTNGIGGVLAGVSEFNLLQAIRISEELGLRFYCSKEQWDMVEVKDKFKALCAQYGVSTPKMFFTGSLPDYVKFSVNELSYPVIVKPVDSSASMGISICSCADEIKAAVSKALDASASGRFLIEQYVAGCEFTAHYTIGSGKAALASLDNRYSSKVHDGNVTSIPVIRAYPAPFIDSYLEHVNESVIALCEGLGLENAVLFIQGIYDKSADKYYVFEAGLRSAAESPCRFIEKFTAQNYVHMLVDYIMFGETDYDVSKERPHLDNKCCAIVSYASPGGVIGSITGLESISGMHQIVDVEKRYGVGDRVPNGDTLRQIVLRFVIVCESRAELSSIIDLINGSVSICDSEGKSMVLPIAAERVFGLD